MIKSNIRKNYVINKIDIEVKNQDIRNWRLIWENK